MEDDYNDPAASERHDEDMLRSALERFRNEVKPSDLRAPDHLGTVDGGGCHLNGGEDYWVWRGQTQ